MIFRGSRPVLLRNPIFFIFCTESGPLSPLWIRTWDLLYLRAAKVRCHQGLHRSRRHSRGITVGSCTTLVLKLLQSAEVLHKNDFMHKRYVLKFRGLSCTYYDLSRDMRFPTIWYFDKCRPRRACAAFF